MPSHLPWYRRRPGRWTKAIEDALASDDAPRRNLAWWIIEFEGGTEHGSQKAFAARFGLDAKRLSRYLRSDRGISEDAQREIAEAVGRSLEMIQDPAHPFGWYFSRSDQCLEPGAPGWRAMWEQCRAADLASYPPVSRLVKEHPEMFPPGFDPDS